MFFGISRCVNAFSRKRIPVVQSSWNNHLLKATTKLQHFGYPLREVIYCLQLLTSVQEWLCFTSLFATLLSQGPSILSWKSEGPLIPGYALQGLVETRYFWYVEPNWISLTLEQHWGDTRFRPCVESKLSSTNVPLTIMRSLATEKRVPYFLE